MGAVAISNDRFEATTIRGRNNGIGIMRYAAAIARPAVDVNPIITSAHQDNRMSVKKGTSREVSDNQTSARAPVILTFLAPAKRCNQNCINCYITEIRNEPVHSFRLSPSDYALFLQHFIEAEIPVKLVSFQGYEVTLPKSWAYLQEVFSLALKYDIRRSFITNGMLLHKHIDSILKLEPSRISVSLDGGDPDTNDEIRGLNGAFRLTLKSIDKFLTGAPEFRNRLAVASTLYSEKNFRSLLKLPLLLRAFGISKWSLTMELTKDKNGHIYPRHDKDVLLRWFNSLVNEGINRGINVFVSDEHGFFKHMKKDYDDFRIYGIYDLNYLYRIDPTGRVYKGPDVMKEISNRDTLWNPNEISAPNFVAYFDEEGGS